MEKCLIVIFLIAIITSCNKDEKESGIETIPCYVTQIDFVWEENCDNNPWQETSRFSFYYDENNQIEKWLLHNHSTYFVYYNEQSQKVKKVEVFRNGELKQYFNFVWEQNRLTTNRFFADGSIYDYSGKMIFELNNSGEPLKIESFDYIEGTWELGWYQILNWQAGNLLKSESYYKIEKISNDFTCNNAKPLRFNYVDNSNIEIDINKSTEEFIKVSSVEIEYDDTNNPLNINHFVIWFSDYQVSSEYGAPFPTKNNPIESRAYYLWNDMDILQTFSYEFNDNNYPVNQRIYYQINHCEYIIENRFAYKCN